MNKSILSISYHRDCVQRALAEYHRAVSTHGEHSNKAFDASMKLEGAQRLLALAEETSGPNSRVDII